jgi:putative ABC transport system permease protein
MKGLNMPEWKQEIRRRLADLKLAPTREAEIVEELAQHLEDRCAESLSSGATEEEACRAAFAELSESRVLAEELRRVERQVPQEPIVLGTNRRTNMIADLWQDLRYGARVLLKQPGFTLMAVLTLALGIGANTTIFSLVDAVVLRPLPFREAERLVWIWATRTDRDKAFYSIPNFIDTRERSRAFEPLAAFANWGANLTAQGEPERLQGIRISAHAFRMLGVEAVAGRTLAAEDDAPDKPRVVMLSYALWQRRFGAERRVIGQPLTLNGDAYTIVGVLPAHFTIPNAEIELAAPLRLEVDPRRGERGSNFLRVLARLKPGVTLEQARAELATITAHLREQYPDENAKLTAPNVLPLHTELIGSYRKALWLLLAAVGMVLLIACANLANLSLVRALARSREMAIRTALGATRHRLVRQMLTESLLLAVAGGALGVLLALNGPALLLRFSPADLPRAAQAGIDGRMLLFSLALTLLAGLVFGLAPAVRATRTDLNAELKEGGSGNLAGARSGRLQNALVVAEVALALLLLIGAGLFGKSYVRLQSVKPGFEASNLLSLRLSLPPASYGKAEAVRVFYDKLAVRLSDLPGVEAVGAASLLPLSGTIARTEFTLAGRPPATAAETPAAQDRWVSPGYFHTMQIPLVRGREFTEADHERAAGVVVIDEVLAQRYWPQGDPLGAHLLLDYGTGEKPRAFEIIGVAGSVKHVGLNEEPTATLYGPLAQIPPSVVTARAANLSIVVRRAQASPTVAASVRRELQAVDPQVPASNVRMMSQYLAAALAGQRFNLLLLGVFAGAALLLATLGIYGVMAYAVTRRTREIGLRLALGAPPRAALKLVTGQGLRLALLGVGLGLVAAFALTRLLSSLLYGVSATDPATFASVALLLVGVAGLACYLPARRAARVDPLAALREE